MRRQFFDHCFRDRDGGVAAMTAMSPRFRVLAQNRMSYSIVGRKSGHVALGLAIRKLGVYGSFMQAPADPDNENNALLAMVGHGMGLRSIDVLEQPRRRRAPPAFQ